MTTIAITIRSVTDDANSVVAEFNEPDPRTGVQKLVNYLSGVRAGSRPGYFSIDIDSATYTATYAANGTAAGDTTVVTITTDEQYQTMKDELGVPTSMSDLFLDRLIVYLNALMCGSRVGFVGLSDSVTQSWNFGRVSP